MPKVFISYRREDSGASAGRLYDRFSDALGAEHVFRDIDAIAPGAQFARIIDERIRSCDALVAVIGKHWLEVKDPQGVRRLDNAGDYVKAEIRSALEQDKQVIPVLVEGATMPAGEDLPGEIAALAERNAIEISETRFDYDSGRLIAAVQDPPDALDVPGGTKGSWVQRGWTWTDNPQRQRTLTFVGGGLAALIAALWAGNVRWHEKPSTPPSSIIVSAEDSSIAAGGTVTASAGSGGAAVVGSGNVVTIGITLEQYEARLKRREQEIRTELAAVGAQDKQRLAQLQTELAAAQAKAQNLEGSLAEYKTKLAQASQALESFKHEVPLGDLKQAQQALAEGDTAAAEGLFAMLLAAGKALAAKSAFQLGELAYSRIEYGKAYGHYLEAVRLQPDNPIYLNTAGNVAHKLGHYQDAQGYLEQALTIRKKALGPNHPDVATSLNNLAVLYQSQGQYEKAEPLSVHLQSVTF